MSVKRIRDRSVESRKSSGPRGWPGPAPAGGERRPKAAEAAKNPREPGRQPHRQARAAVAAVRCPCPISASFRQFRPCDRGRAESGRSLSEAARQGEPQSELAAHVADCMNTFGAVAEHWLKDPTRALEAQTKLATDFVDLWGRTLKRMSGEAGRASRSCGPRRQALRRSGWQEHAGLRLPAAGLQAFEQLGGGYRRETEGSTPPRRRKAASIFVRSPARSRPRTSRAQSRTDTRR